MRTHGRIGHAGGGHQHRNRLCDHCKTIATHTCAQSPPRASFLRLFVSQFFTEIVVPGIFAAIDLLFCIIDFLTPSGWNDQLRCVEEKCFRGPNIVADMLVFTHLPIVLHRFTAIMEATLNSRTGKRFFGNPGPGTFTTKGRTINPDTGQPIERTETESATMGNPIYEFDFADSFKELLPTTGADQCGGCFNCRWPEIRLIWLLTASIGSLFSEQNINGYRGNVTAHCLANGSWYTQACGPMGAELLPYRTWLRRGYTAGFVEIDARIFDSYAATIVKRSREMGASSDEFFPQLVQAARNWEAVRTTADKILRDDFGDNDAAKAAPFVYHVCRNHRHEAKARGLDYDMPHEYYNLAGGSIERITGQFLWDTCRRWKFEIFSDFGRWAHQAIYDIQACTEDKVECKKEARRCYGSCSGVDGSEFKHDFATTVALTELSEFVLGDGFDSAAAANCTVKSYVFKVPTFAGGDSFKTWAARLGSRSGITAIGACCSHSSRLLGCSLPLCKCAQTPAGAKKARPAARSSSVCSSSAPSSDLSMASFGRCTRASNRVRRRRRCHRPDFSYTLLALHRRRRLRERLRRFTRTVKHAFLSLGSSTLG